MSKYQEALDLSLEHKRIIDFHLEKFPKAQEALYNDKDFKEYVSNVDSYCEKYKDYPVQFLQELVDQTKTPTLEEVKKEWEELEYSFNIYNDEYHNGNKYKRCVIYKEIFKNTRLIVLHYYDKRISLNYFWETFDAEGYPTCKYMLFDITLQEHQLLTKTFKALGWLDE